jgi:hypothetical protein
LETKELEEEEECGQEEQEVNDDWYTDWLNSFKLYFKHPCKQTQNIEEFPAQQRIRVITKKNIPIRITRSNRMILRRTKRSAVKEERSSIRSAIKEEGTLRKVILKLVRKENYGKESPRVKLKETILRSQTKLKDDDASYNLKPPTRRRNSLTLPPARNLEEYILSRNEMINEFLNKRLSGELHKLNETAVTSGEATPCNHTPIKTRIFRKGDGKVLKRKKGKIRRKQFVIDKKLKRLEEELLKLNECDDNLRKRIRYQEEAESNEVIKEEVLTPVHYKYNPN